MVKWKEQHIKNVKNKRNSLKGIIFLYKKIKQGQFSVP